MATPGCSAGGGRRDGRVDGRRVRRGPAEEAAEGASQCCHRRHPLGLSFGHRYETWADVSLRTLRSQTRGVGGPDRVVRLPARSRPRGFRGRPGRAAARRTRPTTRSPSYRARSNRRSTARWTRRRSGWNSANATSVDAATASVFSSVTGASSAWSPTTTPTNTATRIPVTIAHPIVRLMIRSISYSRYRRTATATARAASGRVATLSVPIQRNGCRDGRLQAEREQDRRGHHGDQQPLQLLALDPPGAAGTHEERRHPQHGADEDGQAADGVEDGRGGPRRPAASAASHGVSGLGGPSSPIGPGLRTTATLRTTIEPDDDGDGTAPARARQGSGREDEGDGRQEQHDRGVEQQVADEVEPVAHRVGWHPRREHVADRVAGEDPGRHRGGDREQPADRVAVRAQDDDDAQRPVQPQPREQEREEADVDGLSPSTIGRPKTTMSIAISRAAPRSTAPAVGASRDLDRAARGRSSVGPAPSGSTAPAPAGCTASSATSRRAARGAPRGPPRRAGGPRTRRSPAGRPPGPG